LNLFRLVNHWIHLLSVIFWLGGVAYMFLLLVPTLRLTVSEQAAGSVLYALHKQFTTIVFGLTFVLMVTGAVNIGMSRHGGILPPQYVSILGAKLFLAVLFLTIAWRNYLEIRRHPDQQVITEVPFLRLSLTLAVLIVLLAAALRTLYPH
jgi:putative copper export protein